MSIPLRFGRAGPGGTVAERTGEPPVPAGDAALIERSRTEPEAFARLFDAYAPRLHRYVARRVGPDHADDIVAETFLAAFRRRDAYDLARPDAAPWLYGIAANLIAGHRRAEVRMHRAFARTGQGSVAEVVTDGVEDRLAAVAAQRALAGGLAKLTAGEREALLLVAWAEFTYEQVAEALGVPLGTVRSRLHRARAKMRGLLRGHPAADIAEDEA